MGPEDLRIRDKSSRFSAMVMLQGKSVEGLRLQDYMPSEEDREKFERSQPRVGHRGSSSWDKNVLGADQMSWRVRQFGGVPNNLW